MMPVYISDDESKIDIYNKYIPYFRALFILIFIHFFSYMLYTYLVIKRNGVVILKKFKNVESVAINWFRYLSLLSLILGIFCISIYVLHIFFSFNTLILNLVADLFIVILLHFLAYKGIRRIEILQYIPDTAVSKKYARSNMNQLQAENYMESVIQFVKREKNFLNSEINLKLLSSSLSISEHHLSQIFSQYMGITFNDYVNKLRIEEAKRLISERADDYPILRIGFDVGFNSKSSFNANFKKFTDMTPSEFKSEKGD